MPCLFLLFTLDYLSEYSHSDIALMELIAKNLPCYLHIAFCLFVWLIQLKCVPHTFVAIRMCNIENLKEETFRPQITGGPNLKRGGTSDPFSCHAVCMHVFILPS